MKKKIKPLTDLDKMPFGDHIGVQMRYVPALYLFSLIGTKALKQYPRVKAYIDRGIRQLRAEVRATAAERKEHLHD